MADEKKYTAQEAAQAVLKKAEEMLKSHSKHIGWDKLEAKLEGEGYSKKTADKINGSIKAKVEKSEVVDQARADGGEKSSDNELTKADYLANKRGKVSPAGHIASANRSFAHAKNPNASSPKIERQMGKESMAAAKMGHTQKLADIKSQPKPNLTKADGEIHPKEKQAGESEHPGKRVEAQAAPEANPKENAEGNNEKAGTTPTQVGEDQKNKPGFDEMNSLMKLAKFMGRMEQKKSTKVEA